MAKKNLLSLKQVIREKLITLTPPKISLENIQEKIICIRGHRERIFRVESELSQDKCIFHNYGQGGAGWTFLFGCVHKSVQDFTKLLEQNTYLKNKPIAVIGAGCYGLLTAIILTRLGYSVRIYAKETERIASQNAAGFFFPRHRKCSNFLEIEQFRSIGMESYKTYQRIIHGEHEFIKQGPKLLPAYFGLDIAPGFEPYISAGLMGEPEEVKIDFGNSKIYPMREYRTVFINSDEIMGELNRNICELAIPVITAEINNFKELSEPIIFNCTGMGAKKLAQDKRIVAVQGHLITLKNQPAPQQLQYLINVKVIMTDTNNRSRDELIYFAPKNAGILGVTFIRGEDSLTANHHEFDRLLTRCKDFFGP